MQLVSANCKSIKPASVNQNKGSAVKPCSKCCTQKQLQKESWNQARTHAKAVGNASSVFGDRRSWAYVSRAKLQLVLRTKVAVGSDVNVCSVLEGKWWFKDAIHFYIPYGILSVGEHSSWACLLHMWNLRNSHFSFPYAAHSATYEAYYQFMIWSVSVQCAFFMTAELSRSQQWFVPTMTSWHKMGV